VDAHAGLAEELFARAEAADDLSIAAAGAAARSSGGGASKKGKKGASAAAAAGGDGGSGDAAIRLFAACLKHQPDMGAAYMRMGLALERQGLLAEALACLDKAVKCDPTLVKQTHTHTHQKAGGGLWIWHLSRYIFAPHALRFGLSLVTPVSSSLCPSSPPFPRFHPLSLFVSLTQVGAHVALGRLSTESEDVVAALEQACFLVNLTPQIC